MTDEGQRQADAVLQVLDKAMREIESFYDCRIVLGSLMGVVSGFAASLYRAGVLQPQDVAAEKYAGLQGAFEKQGKTPHIVYEGQNQGDTKQ